MGSSIRDFAERLSDLSDSAAISDYLMSVIEPLGFGSFAYHLIQAPDIDQVAPRTATGISSYPEPWKAHYVSNGYVNHDPVVEKVFEEKTPFVWSRVIHPASLSRQQSRLLDDARGIGIMDGLTIPLLPRRGETASLSLVPNKLDPEALNDPGLHNHVHLLGEFLHSRAARIVVEEAATRNSRRRRSILSPREDEVLTWVARGKSTWDVSRLLGISEKAVDFHLDATKRKLQATNRTQAVVKAVVMGIITFG
ncbi:LuxR family transcriptional regulator [Nguyenibacter vanlangensis]|uniref:LuxR family transcriptional regulator n=2 Tax=Nguyenibacter vanlangensis TaxID=1216886 RepID=A0A7Y7ITZ7_9PROT|nr:LuxR family transcriptional regulator [Nguyenibacter vanlangensis]